MFEHFSTYHVTLCTGFCICVGNKTVRVGYFPYANFQEGSYGKHKQGAGYEYLQKISYITGWKYEYVYASFKECLDMLADGEIDLLGSVSYTPERAEFIDFSTYAAGTERYWIYTREDHTELTDGDPKQMNGCRIGVAEKMAGQQSDPGRGCYL